MNRLSLATLSALVLVALPAAAQEPANDTAQTQAHIGPVVGAAAPSLDSAIPVPPASGPAATGEYGRALVFFRSADWCPFCKTQLVELNAISGDLAEAGWTLEAISYDSPEVLAAFSEAEGLGFTLLSDEGSQIIDAFGLRNEDVRAGSRTDGIPHPAIIFISNEGRVKAVLREEGYRERPEIAAILETARLLSEVETATGE